VVAVVVKRTAGAFGLGDSSGQFYEFKRFITLYHVSVVFGAGISVGDFPHQPPIKGIRVQRAPNMLKPEDKSAVGIIKFEGVVHWLLLLRINNFVIFLYHWEKQDSTIIYK